MKLLQLSGLENRLIDEVALFKDQNYNERLCCTYEFLSRLTNDVGANLL